MEEHKKRGEEKRTLFVRNMLGNCCLHLVRLVLDAEGIRIEELKPGRITLTIDPALTSWKKIEAILNQYGLEVVTNREKMLVEQIKAAMVDLVQNSTYNAMVRNSDYLVERFGMSYPYISALFSKHEATTLEKFTILLKIEKVKDLIRSGELTLSEIAYMMGYSSVQYLSTQFKSITGVSVTDFRLDPFGELPEPADK